MSKKVTSKALCEELGAFIGFEVIFNKNKGFACKKGLLTSYEEGKVKVYLALPPDLLAKIGEFYKNMEAKQS